VQFAQYRACPFLGRSSQGQGQWARKPANPDVGGEYADNMIAFVMAGGAKRRWKRAFPAGEPSVLMGSEPKALVFFLTRFLPANRVSTSLENAMQNPAKP
jgi:hypothetical protein